MSGIRKNFFFQLLYAVSQALFPLLTYPYITRTIGAEGLGKIGYIEYVSGFMITLAAFGIPFYGVREVAKVQHDPVKSGKLFQELFVIQFLLSCVGVIFFLILIHLSKQDVSFLLTALGCITILLPPFTAEWYMQGTEAFQFTTVRSILLRLAALLAMFLFITSPKDYASYYLIIVLVQAAVSLSNLYKIGFSNINFRPTGLKQHVKPLFHFFITASIISVYVFFDVIILGWVADNTEVGYYTLAIKLVKLSLLIVLSLNVILFPRMSKLKTSDDLKTLGVLLQKSLSFMLTLTLPIAAGFYFLSDDIVSLIGGEKFRKSVVLVQTLSCLPLLIGLSSLFVYQVLIPFGKEKKLLKAVCITCVAGISLQILLSNAYGAEGTAMATTLTEFSMLLLTGLYSIRTFSFQWPFKVLYQTIVALVPFVCLVFANRYFATDPLMLALLSLLPGMLLYTLIQVFVFKNQVALEALSSLHLKKKIKAVHG